MKKHKKPDRYSLDKILAADAQWNVIYGGRSNGKTYAVHEFGIKTYLKTGGQMAIIRRWNDDFQGVRSITMFDNQVCNGDGENNIKRLSGGKWDGVKNIGKRWYLTAGTGDDMVVDEKPFAIGFAITAMEHDKSTAYPMITTVLFDEFLTRTTYLNDEFILFTNTLKTIIRERTNVKIFMCGNTVNAYCPYFREMGLTRVKDMPEGTIDVYTYGDSPMRVAVEHTASIVSHSSSIYFAFDNPRLSMVRGSSEWEIDVYPHCSYNYGPSDIVFTFFIVFDGDILQCECVQAPMHDGLFLFVHPKTTELKHPDSDLIYSMDTYDIRPNWDRNLFTSDMSVSKKICALIKRGKIFYSDNTTGEIMRNYMLACGVRMR